MSPSFVVGLFDNHLPILGNNPADCRFSLFNIKLVWHSCFIVDIELL